MDACLVKTVESIKQAKKDHDDEILRRTTTPPHQRQRLEFRDKVTAVDMRALRAQAKVTRGAVDGVDVDSSEEDYDEGGRGG